MGYNRSRLVKQHSACGDDPAQQLFFFAAEQTFADSPEIGPKPPHSIDPILSDAKIQAVELIGLGQSSDCSQIHLGEQALANLVEPCWPGNLIGQKRPAADRGNIAALESFRNPLKPVWLDVDIVVEESNNVVSCLCNRAISGVTQSEPLLEDVPKPASELRQELMDDLRGLIRAGIIDHQDLVILVSRIHACQTREG